MLKASEVIGRQITVREGGQDVGKVKDLVVDPTGRDVIGLVISEGLFSGSRVAAWKSVQAFGPDNVVLDSAVSVVKSTALPEIKEVLDKDTKIKGLKLVTTKGKELGKITDFLFDDASGGIVGYELSSGLFSNAFDGTPFLPTPLWIELGKDVAFVDPGVEDTITPSGGLRSAFRRGEKAAETPAGGVSSPSAPSTPPAASEPPAPMSEAPATTADAGADTTGSGTGGGAV